MPPPRPKPGAPAAASASAEGALDDQRVRQIYAQYVAEKRKRNESTAAITYDALAKSLRESAQKLQEKHGKSTSVDFEVSEKDGKTVLRPVLRR